LYPISSHITLLNTFPIQPQYLKHIPNQTANLKHIPNPTAIP
jgi:hypothetical protein